MIRIAFCSQITNSNPTMATLADIVGVSSRNNLRDDITGLLICDENHFLEVLEGGVTDIDRTLARIMSDARHSNLSMLLREPANGRRFGGWTMLSSRTNPLIAGDLQALIKTCVAAPDRGGEALLNFRSADEGWRA